MTALRFALVLFLTAAARAQAVSDWQGMAPDGNGNWSEAGNWNPAVVPNNGGGNLYDVTIRQRDPDIEYAGPTLDIWVTLENLTLIDRAAVRTDPDNSVRLTVDGVTSLTTSLGNDGAFGRLEVNSGSVFSLHQLANLNNGVLTGSYAITAGANGAVLEFDNADVTNNQAYISLSGAMADLRDRISGQQALRNLSMNGGTLLLDNGRALNLNGALTNAGWLLLTHDRVAGDEFDLTHEFLSGGARHTACRGDGDRRRFAARGADPLHPRTNHNLGPQTFGKSGLRMLRDDAWRIRQFSRPLIAPPRPTA